MTRGQVDAVAETYRKCIADIRKARPELSLQDVMQRAYRRLIRVLKMRGTL